jgi:hypothetical protein
MKIAPNFAPGPGAAARTPLSPLPVISHFTTRTFTVPTSSGPRAATEITIHGSNFAIRAVDPDVIVNGIPLVHFQISDDFQTLTGYFFGPLTQPIFSVIVDYGGGVRGEWTGVAGGGGAGGVAGGLLRRLILILLLLLLLLLLLAAAVFVLGGISISALGWALLIGAIVLDVVAVVVLLLT